MFSGFPSVRPSVCPSVRQSVRPFFMWSPICYQTCEHDVLKTNEPILAPIDTSGPWSKGMKRSTLGSGGQRSRSQEAEIGHKNPIRLDVSRTIRRILTKLGRHIITVNAHCATTTRIQKKSKVNGRGIVIATLRDGNREFL